MVEQKSDFETLLARMMEQLGDKVSVRQPTAAEEREGIILSRTFEQNAQVYFSHVEKSMPIDRSQIVFRSPSEVFSYPIKSLYDSLRQGIEHITAYLRK